MTSGGTVASSFFNVLAGDKVIGRQPSVGNRRYYHGDLLGSTRSVVDGATVVEASDYDPWGLLMPGRTLGSGTKQGFTGKEQDAETGLDYFGARYYLPALARWGGVDPLGEKHPEWSPYNYVLNNPNGLVDPDGQQVAALAAEYSSLYNKFGEQAANQQAKRNLDATITAISALTGFLPIGRVVGGLLSTGLDAASGNLSFWGTAVNFATAGEGKVAEQAVEDAAGVTRTVEKLGGDAAQYSSKSASEMGSELANDIGRNRVSVRTSGSKQIDIDLQGKAHFEKPFGKIEAPHVRESSVNMGPNGKTNLSNKTVRPATKQDIRTARKITKRREGI